MNCGEPTRPPDGPSAGCGVSLVCLARLIAELTNTLLELAREGELAEQPGYVRQGAIQAATGGPAASHAPHSDRFRLCHSTWDTSVEAMVCGDLNQPPWGVR